MNPSPHCVASPITGTPYTFAEFFAGIGLVRLGLQNANQRWLSSFANDNNEKKRTIYQEHFGSTEAFNTEDVCTLKSESVPDVDLATASFPCTDLSFAGARRGIHAGESSAFWGFQRILREMGSRRPRLILLENVVGFLGSNKGQDFETAMTSLNQLGYSVDSLVLDARWFVPQSRPRLFVVGVQHAAVRAANVNLLAYDGPATRIRPKKLIDYIKDHPAICWHNMDLPCPPLAATRALLDIVADPPQGHPDWWNEQRVAYLQNQMFERHANWITARLNSSEYEYATVFRRMRSRPDGAKRSTAELRIDGVAGCLRTPKGGSGRQILVRVGRGRVDARLVSPIECAALMGAEGYETSAKVNDALFAFGDAVCVPAVAWLAQHYLAPILEANRRARTRNSTGDEPAEVRTATRETAPSSVLRRSVPRVGLADQGDQGAPQRP